MPAKVNPDGTIDVRVVLTVRVDPDSWVARVMDEHPTEVLQSEVRRNVKRYVRDLVAGHDEGAFHSIKDVAAQGVYVQGD